MERRSGSVVVTLSISALIGCAVSAPGIAAQQVEKADGIGVTRVVRGQDVLTVEQEMPPDSTRLWREVQRLIAQEKAPGFSSTKKTFSLLEAKRAPDSNESLPSIKFTSYDGIVMEGFYGEVEDGGINGVRVSFVFNPKMICLPEREVQRVYKNGEAVTPLPPQMAEIPVGVVNSSDRSGYWHGVRYQQAAKNIIFHFFPSGCASDFSVFWKNGALSK